MPLPGRCPALEGVRHRTTGVPAATDVMFVPAAAAETVPTYARTTEVPPGMGFRLMPPMSLIPSGCVLPLPNTPKVRLTTPVDSVTCAAIAGVRCRSHVA